MAISTNSIIHYTGSFETLTKILDEGFKIKYCSEILYLGDNKSSAAHPMITFCDIPLSDSTQHFDKYGKYGIGLTKQWAVKNGVNPVLYIDKNSLFALTIAGLLQERRKAESNLTEQQKSEILKIKAYAKNYSGTLKRDGIVINIYKFYDEREWRLVPKGEQINDAPFSISLSNYTKNKNDYNRQIEDVRIRFETEDVSYIIVERTNEIPLMVNFIRDSYRKRCTAEQLDILFSKICSTEQIIADHCWCVNI